MWEYRARTVRVIDADTIVVLLDLGLRVYHETPLRLLDVRAPEMVGADRKRGEAAKAECKRWLDEGGYLFPNHGWPLVVRTQKDGTDKYGRYLATVTRTLDGRSLNADLNAWLLEHGGPGGR